MQTAIRFDQKRLPPETADLRAEVRAFLADEIARGTFDPKLGLKQDAFDREFSRLFRGRSGPTDVLAFPYDPADSGGVHGDVYVSLDRARAQAAERREPLEREIWRLFVHGALHLAGRDHDSDETERAMLAAQEKCVERVFPGGESTASGR